MTTSALAVRLGSQQPRVLSVPSAVSTSGGEACELAASVGVHLDPWQRLVMEGMLGERADGRWAAFETGLLVARQNGKGEILLALALSSLFLLEDKLLLHSAHEFKTAQEAFLRLKSVLDGSDDLRKQIKTIRTSHGEEGVELLNGCRLRFVARSKSSGRGFTVHRAILDEAQELPRRAVAALLPTMSATPNPQIIYTGTVPGPDVHDPEHWESIRDRGRAGTDPSLAWFEWSPTDDGEVDPADRSNWYAANPALGIRISEEYVSSEHRTLDPDSFERERLSVWRNVAAGTVLNEALWAGLTDPGSQPLAPMRFAVDVNLERSAVSIAVAGRRSDGRMHCELVDARPGMDWVVDRVAGLTSSVMLDGRGPVNSLIPALEAAGVNVTSVSTQEMGQACGAFYDSATQDGMRHTSGPVLHAKLAAAVAAARKQPRGDVWVWSRKDQTDISPLVAVTLASWGVEQASATDMMNNVW